MTQEPQNTNQPAETQPELTADEQKALAIMTDSVVNRHNDVSDNDAEFVVRQLKDTKAQNADAYANALEEFLAEEEKLTGKQRHDKALETFYYIETEAFLNDAQEKLAASYQNDNPDETMTSFMADMRHGDVSQVASNSNALHLITSEDNDDERQSLVTALLNNYASEKAKDGFDFNAFMEGVDRDYRQYEQEKFEASIDEDFDAAIDQYYEGDKDHAKALKDQMSLIHKMQLGTAMKNLAEQEANAQLKDGQKEEAIKNYNTSMGQMVAQAEHRKVMDPLSREFQDILEQNYQGEQSDEKKAEMARYATPFFMQNIADNILDDKKHAAQQEAEAAGKAFDENAFHASLQRPTQEEIRVEAADLVRRMKEDVSQDDLQSGLTQGYDTFAKEAEKHIAAQEAERLAALKAQQQNQKPSRLNRFGTAALSIGAGAAVGFGVRTAFNAAGGYTALAGLSVAGFAITPVAAAVTIAVVGGLAAGSVSYAVSNAVRTYMTTGRQDFRANYKSNFSRSGLMTSALLSGVAAGVVAGWGDQIAATASSIWENTGGALFGGAANATSEVAEATTTGGWNFLGLGDIFGGGDDAASLAPEAGAVDPLETFGGAGPDITAASPDAANPDRLSEIPEVAAAAEAPEVGGNGDAATMDAAPSLPTAVDADLKELIESVIRDAAERSGGGLTSYESSIIARLGEGTLGQQLQAAKDASVLFGGELQMDIIARLYEDFGGYLSAVEGSVDPQLERAINQVTSDYGILFPEGPEAVPAATAAPEAGTTTNPLYTEVLCEDGQVIETSQFNAEFAAAGLGDAPTAAAPDIATQHMDTEYGMTGGDNAADTGVERAEMAAAPDAATAPRTDFNAQFRAFKL